MRYNNNINKTAHYNTIVPPFVEHCAVSSNWRRPREKQPQPKVFKLLLPALQEKYNTNTCTYHEFISDLLISMYNFNMIGLFGKWNGVCGGCKTHTDRDTVHGVEFFSACISASGLTNCGKKTQTHTSTRMFSATDNK